jgi:hypothetical protein
MRPVGTLRSHTYRNLLEVLTYESLISETSLRNNRGQREWIPFAQHKHPLGMRQVPSNVAAVDEVSQNAFHLIQVDRHSQPLEHLHDVPQRDLRLLQHKVHPQEQIAVANGLALL